MTVGSACASLPSLRHVWQLDTGALAQLVERGRAIPTTTVDVLRRIVLPTRPRSSPTPPGRRGTPRAAPSPTATSPAPATPSSRAGDTRLLPRSAARHPRLPALLARVRHHGPGALSAGRHPAGHEPDLSEETLSAALLSFRPTYLYAVPFVFEKIYKNFCDPRNGLGSRSSVPACRPDGERLRRGRRTPATGHRLRPRLRPASAAHPRPRRPSTGSCGPPWGTSVRRGVGRLPAVPAVALFSTRASGSSSTTATGSPRRAAASRLSPWGARSSGTVGRALPGTDIRVAEDGEILVWGPSVFQGYVNDPPSTHAAFQDGWLATGDLGRLDTEGIRDHRPQEGRHHHERRQERGSRGPRGAAARPPVDPHQAVVVGDNRPCVGALITLDPDFLAHWRGAWSKGGRPARDAREENELREEVEHVLVAAANSTVSRSESIRVFRVLPEPFDQTNGLLTPSMSCAGTPSHGVSPPRSTRCTRPRRGSRGSTRRASPRSGTIPTTYSGEELHRPLPTVGKWPVSVRRPRPRIHRPPGHQPDPPDRPQPRTSPRTPARSRTRPAPSTPALPADGTWRLRVMDDTPGVLTVDPGHLDGWNLTFRPS